MYRRARSSGSAREWLGVGQFPLTVMRGLATLRPFQPGDRALAPRWKFARRQLLDLSSEA